MNDVKVQRPTIRERWRQLSRARKAALISPAALLGLVGAAAAAMLFVAPIGGSVGVAGATVAFTSASANPTTGDTALATCSSTVTSGKLMLTFTGSAGDSCDVDASFKVSGTVTDLVLQDVSFASGVKAGIIGAGGNYFGCGGTTSLPTSTTSQTRLRFTIPATATTGDTYPADATAGLKAVRKADYVAANCPQG